MSAIVEWQLRLIDRISGPSRTIEDRLNRIERQLNMISRGQRNMGRDTEDAARRMDRAYAKTESRLGRLKAGVMSFAKISAGIGLAAGGAGAVALGRAALGGMSGREGSLMSLGTLLKGQTPQEVKVSASWINQFADITPFEDGQVMASVKQLLASQFSFAQTKGIANVTGNAASALGSDTADAAFKWQIINRALGQIKAKGRVQGDELLQLQEAGIGTNAYLEKYVGKDYRDLMQKGQLSANRGLSAILKGLDDDFGGSMERMATTFDGLMSTLVSRPQRIFGQMFDAGGLGEAKTFMQNLVRMTDFSRPPGDRILKRLSGLGARIMNAIFGPLAKATSGDGAMQTIDRLLDKLDGLAGWFEQHTPFLRSVLEGMGSGFMMMFRVMQWGLRPITRLLRVLGLLGDDATGLGKFLGMLLAGVVAMKLFGLTLGFLMGPVPAIIRLFGALTLLNVALPMLVSNGVLSAAMAGRLATALRPLLGLTRVAAILTGGWRGALIGLGVAGGRLLSRFLFPIIIGFTRFRRLMGAGRGFFAAIRGAALFAARFGWIARALALASNPIGWIIAGVTALVVMYNRFDRVKSLVDGLGDSFRGVAQSAVKWFMTIPDQLRGKLGELYDSLFPPYIRDLAARVGIIMPERSDIDPNYVAPYTGTGSKATLPPFQPLGSGIITSPAANIFNAPMPQPQAAPTVVVNLNGPATPEAVQDITGQVGNVLQGYSIENGYGGANQ